MKKFGFGILISIFALTFVFTLSFTSSAAVDFIKPLEFGEFAGDNDYDFDGGNDYDFDYDYDDDRDYDYGNNDNDYDYGAGRYGSGTTHVSSRGGYKSAIVIALIIVVVLILKDRLGKGKKPNSKPVIRETVMPDTSFLPIADYKNIDPAFSDAEFKEKVSNLYIRFQNSWQAKNLSDVRPYLSDAMFAQVDRQLENYRKNKTTNRVEDIAVLSVKLIGYKQEQNTDFICVELRTRIKDYVVDDASGIVVRGNPKLEKFMCYRWTFARTTGFKTAENAGYQAKSCPHCGAAVDINQSTVCEYCGSVLLNDTFDWVVNNIEAISQKTV